jgi:hypothetical protein
MAAFQISCIHGVAIGSTDLSCWWWCCVECFAPETIWEGWRGRIGLQQASKIRRWSIAIAYNMQWMQYSRMGSRGQGAHNLRPAGTYSLCRGPSSVAVPLSLASSLAKSTGSSRQVQVVSLLFAQLLSHSLGRYARKSLLTLSALAPDVTVPDRSAHPFLNRSCLAIAVGNIAIPPADRVRFLRPCASMVLATRTGHAIRN